ncbi:MAG: type II secretion system protein [Verrucomicrobiota bacterium]|jgi:type II secretory pathway pseudopilin PulG
MTLIEVIGVLAVIAILAAVLLPALIKETDKVVADQETASLQSFGDAFQRNVMRYRRIPGVAGFDWATNIAAELGVNINSVTNNLRQQPRVLLVDTNGFGTMALPYVQTNAGTTLPANPRLMIVSSLGKSLPSGVVSGGPLTSDFANLWNSAPGTVPASGVWSGWTGSANDITVQRINLSPLFVYLLLSTYNSSWSCYYAIDTASMSAPLTTWFGNYFLQNSILNLYFTNATEANGLTLDSQQILIRDSSFVFYGNEWVRSIGTNAVAGAGGGGGGGTNLGNYDFSGLIDGFLAAKPTSLGRIAQTNVVTTFTTFMNAYNAWAAGGFSSSALGHTAYLDQQSFQSAFDALYNNIPQNYATP